MMTSDDKVGGWVKKGQNHDDVILEWSLTDIIPNETLTFFLALSLDEICNSFLLLFEKAGLCKVTSVIISRS